MLKHIQTNHIDSYIRQIQMLQQLHLHITLRHIFSFQLEANLFGILAFELELKDVKDRDPKQLATTRAPRFKLAFWNQQREKQIIVCRAFDLREKRV